MSFIALYCTVHDTTDITINYSMHVNKGTGIQRIIKTHNWHFCRMAALIRLTYRHIIPATIINSLQQLTNSALFGGVQTVCIF